MINFHEFCIYTKIQGLLFDVYIYRCIIGKLFKVTFTSIICSDILCQNKNNYNFPSRKKNTPSYATNVLYSSTGFEYIIMHFKINNVNLQSMFIHISINNVAWIKNGTIFIVTWHYIFSAKIFVYTSELMTSIKTK